MTRWVRCARSALLRSWGTPITPSYLNEHARLKVRNRRIIRLAYCPQMTASLTAFPPFNLRLVKRLILRRILIMMVLKFTWHPEHWLIYVWLIMGWASGSGFGRSTSRRCLSRKHKLFLEQYQRLVILLLFGLLYLRVGFQRRIKLSRFHRRIICSGLRHPMMVMIIVIFTC